MELQERPARVLVGVDGSPASLAALHFAASEARLRDATLVVLMAVEPPDYAWIDPYAARPHPDEALLDQARARLATLVAGAATAGLETDLVVTTGPAPAGLVTRSAGADLLVVGSRGHGGFRGLVMGSVSLQCVLHAHCPVTVVRPEPEPAPAADRAPWTLEDARRQTTAPMF